MLAASLALGHRGLFCRLGWNPSEKYRVDDISIQVRSIRPLACLREGLPGSRGRTVV